MIVDSHAYCFEPVDSLAGHSSSQQHLRWVQLSHARHHQPAWRVRDRAAASSQPLAPGGRLDLGSLPDVAFRVDRLHGRAVWTVGGEDYTKQYFPPNLRDMEFAPHGLIAEMDYAGVDMALLHTDPMLGRDVAYQARCVGLYPHRLRSMAPVDEWRVLPETDQVIQEVFSAITDFGLHAVKFNAPMAYISGPQPWDDGPYRPFWQAVAALGVPVFFTLGSGPADHAPGSSPAQQRAGYLQELGVLLRWMERYPDAVCAITHGFPWRLLLERSTFVLPEALWEPFLSPNCHLEVCFPVRIGDIFDYPYREVWPTLRAMVERVGADRLMWGSDMPFQNRFCTYRQSLSWIGRYCDFMGPKELGQVMGGTAARVMGLETGTRPQSPDRHE